MEHSFKKTLPGGDYLLLLNIKAHSLFFMKFKKQNQVTFNSDSEQFRQAEDSRCMSILMYIIYVMAVG